MNIKRIFVTVFLGALMLLTCFVSAEKDSEKLYAEMPDIVFVKFYWDYNDIITGEYIDKYGCIRSFEFCDMELYSELDNSYPKFSTVKKINQYADVRNIKKVHDLVVEQYKDITNNTENKTIDADVLKQYYVELLQVNINKKMISCSFYDNTERGWSSMYGIRKNENNSEEFVFIRDYGNAYLTSKEKHTENLFYALHTVFSQMEPMINGW
ncbi:MAG: hypothetical protein IJC04_01015 [Oscillospiraceae bacterium]|nr:hypothetical protein [Oscillospiraceae bacterium]